MLRSIARSSLLVALVSSLVAAPSRADDAPTAAAPAATTSDSGSTSKGATNGGSSWTAPAANNMTNRLVYAGVGEGGGYGSFFAVRGGLQWGFVSVADGFSLNGYAEVGLGICCGYLFVPLEAGATVSYDKLPVKIFAGLGFTAIPNTVSGASTPLGVDIMTMGVYPLPIVAKGFSAQVELGVYAVSGGWASFHSNFGVGYSF